MKYHVPDMSCGHCKATIETALSTLDPAIDITVDLSGRIVEVETGKSSDGILQALSQAGFPAQPISA